MLNRRKPLRRGTPLARTSRLAARRATPRRSSYFRDDAYLAFVRSQPCAIARHFALPTTSCTGPCDPDHQREGAGAGQKRPDPFAYPACRIHHDDRHAARGPWARLSRAERNHVIRVLVGASQARWYGRALTDADLSTVRAAVEAGRSTRGLFTATNPIPAAAGRPEAADA